MSTCVSSSSLFTLYELLPYGVDDDMVDVPSWLHVLPLSVDFSTTSFLPLPEARCLNVTLPG
jgi:hypothetical protein